MSKQSYGVNVISQNVSVMWVRFCCVMVSLCVRTSAPNGIALNDVGSTEPLGETRVSVQHLFWRYCSMMSSPGGCILIDQLLLYLTYTFSSYFFLLEHVYCPLALVEPFNTHTHTWNTTNIWFDLKRT